MAIDDSTSIIPEIQINNGLNIEINDADGTRRCEESAQRIDDRIKIGLLISASRSTRIERYAYNHRQTIRQRDKIRTTNTWTIVCKIVCS